MPDFTIEPYGGADETGLLDVWNAALPRDPVDAPTFRRKVLLDPNFDPGWLLVARDRGRLAGFCLCVIRRVPLPGGDLEPARGWITAFGVHPACRSRGIGSGLLREADRLFREAGRREVLMASYTPHYFAPGVDELAYASGLAFLRTRGYETIARPLSMDASIVALDCTLNLARVPGLRSRGIAVRALETADIPTFMVFLRAHMPPDWYRHAGELLTATTLGHAFLDQVSIAVCDDEVVGYCMHEGEHFGPFGVRSDLRGAGIGTVLLATTLQAMRARGLHNAWVLWTSDDAAERIYSRFGFRETRRFAVLRKAVAVG
jgi:ribosomal protein S18 acetylase RimI-like enzyme